MQFRCIYNYASLNKDISLLLNLLCKHKDHPLTYLRYYISRGRNIYIIKYNTADPFSHNQIA